MADGMGNGWICLSRDIATHWIFSDAERFRWWVDLLLLASWESHEVMTDGHIVELQAGQMLASVAFLCGRWGRSKHTVLRFLQLLQDDGMISRKILHRQTAILTICNYERYQRFDDDSLHTLEHTLEHTQVHTNITNNNISLFSEIDKQDIKTKQDIKLSISSNRESSGKPDDAEEPQIDTAKFIAFFNATLSGNNSIIPRIKALTARRITALKARGREYGKDALAEVVRKAAASDFLNGGNDRSFVASFDWMFCCKNNFPKILEGNYDNRPDLPPPVSGSRSRPAHGTRQFYNDSTREYTDDI